MVDKPQSKKLAAARAELEELRRRVEELEAQLEASAGAEDSASLSPMKPAAASFTEAGW